MTAEDDSAESRYTERQALHERFLAESIDHDDKMLMWLTGLMGAALFALPTILSEACSTRQPFGLVAAPWVAGVILSLAGRVVARWRRDATWLYFRGDAWRARAVRKEVTQGSTDAAAILRRWENDPALKTSRKKAERIDCASTVVFYLTTVAFAGGILAAYWAISTCART